jgi:uncharacterized RDD family membrane protein YckC
MIRAGFWRRALAWLIDVMIVFAPTFIIVNLVFTLLDNVGLWNQHAERVVRAASYVPWLLYNGLEIVRHATVGKMALGMRVVSLDGTPADRWTRTMRYIGKQYPFAFYAVGFAIDNAAVQWIGSIGLLVVGIGCLPALGEEKRAWHDQWAGTAVERRRPTAAGFDAVTPPRLPS